MLKFAFKRVIYVMKKLLSIFLVIALIITGMPLGAFEFKASAATSGTTGDCTWTLDGTILTISGNGDMQDYLGEYYVEDSVEYFYDYAPWKGKISKVIIEDSVTSIGNKAFYYCDSLTSITIGDSVTSIGSSAFYSCDSLTSVSIGNSVTSIGDYAFYYCDRLKRVYYRGSISDKSKISIASNNSSLTNATWYYNSCIGSADHTYGDDKVCDECGHKNFVLGDIDGTGKVDLTDVTIISQYMAGWDVDCNSAALDVNADGGVNLKDLVLLAQYVAGWDVQIS